MKNPNEIFTYSVEDKSELASRAVNEYHCRYLDNKCDKKSQGVQYPMGVCSVNYGVNKPIICPHRFLENNSVFINAATSAFGDTNNVLLFKEIGIRRVGTFDFVLVKHKPISSQVEDFCIVEFQSDSTTATGALVDALKDFMNGEDVSQNAYPFGLNTYNTLKLSYIQMLIKGQILERWNKNVFWIMQKYVYDNMVNRFGLIDLGDNPAYKTHYHIYDLFQENAGYVLKMVETHSTTNANLIRAFTHQPTPNIDTFIKVLEKRIKLKLGLTIENG